MSITIIARVARTLHMKKKRAHTHKKGLKCLCMHVCSHAYAAAPPHSCTLHYSRARVLTQSLPSLTTIRSAARTRTHACACVYRVRAFSVCTRARVLFIVIVVVVAYQMCNNGVRTRLTRVQAALAHTRTHHSSYPYGLCSVAHATIATATAARR